MLYDALVQAALQVTATSKRSEKTAVFAALLRQVEPAEAPIVIGLLLGEPRQGRVGIGWATLRDARGETATSTATATATVTSTATSTSTSTATVTVREVDDVISALAAATGAGSQREREQRLASLMGRLTVAEQQHLIRLFSGEMRQGANAGVLTDAVAKAAGVALADVRRAAMLLGDLGEAARRALAGESLAVGLVPLVGVQPMLAATAASVTDALALTGPASVEWKLDGARVQVHRRDDEVRVFTRTLHEISARVPEVVQAALSIPHDDFVLDGEALGLDADGNPLKFQDTMSGQRALRPFFFDVLHLAGQSLIDEPLRARKAALAEAVPAAMLLPTLDVDGTDASTDATAADRFAAQALAAGHEGVMVKALESTYQAGRRGATWRKVKPVHTLDLVVLAAEWGHGRRTGWLSNLHLGARGADGTFVMVGKTFKGLTDELLRWQTTELQARAIGDPEQGYIQHVRPELVVEIALDGVQRSVRYPGGVALRFARVRRYRLDKTAAQADTIESVQAML